MYGGGLNGGLGDGAGRVEEEAVEGGGRREGGEGRRSSSENPHRLADQSKGLESVINVVETSTFGPGCNLKPCSRTSPGRVSRRLRVFVR